MTQEEIWSLSLEEAERFYAKVWSLNDNHVVRELIKIDRFFLLTEILGVTYAVHPWAYARCREVERNPDGYLDLWARGHMKSTIITFAGIIQEVMKNPDITIGIFSFKAPAAKAFLDQIKTQFENNRVLRDCFPDILWPEREDGRGNKWSVDNGIFVKRTTAKKEATVAAYGVVEGQPTGMHFDLMVYDDVVTLESITEEMIRKTNDAMSMSTNLAVATTRKWMIGTRYARFDTYYELMRRGSVKERRHTCFAGDGLEGEPAFFTREQLEQKRIDLSPKDWASQMLQEPVGEQEAFFDLTWVSQRYGDAPQEVHTRENDVKKLLDWKKLNRYIFVDNSHGLGGKSDFTVLWCIGVSESGQRYALDLVRDRLDLDGRIDAIFNMHRKWSRPLQMNSVQTVYFELNGFNSDIKQIQKRMIEKLYNFAIEPIKQSVPKKKRIEWLIAPFKNGQIQLPYEIHNFCKYDGREHDTLREFVEDEFASYPSVRHDDMIDCLANMYHPSVKMSLPVGQSAEADSSDMSYGDEGWDCLERDY